MQLAGALRAEIINLPRSGIAFVSRAAAKLAAVAYLGECLKFQGGKPLCLACALRAPSGSARGFTLTELLVVLIVAGVLVTLAAPSLQATLQANRVDAVTNQFVATLSMARSEAVKLGCTVNVTAAPTAVANSWSNGWSVAPAPGCASLGGNNAPSPPPAIQSVGPLTGPMSAAGSVAQLAFNSLGQMAGNNGPTTEADFIFCADGVTAAYPMAQGVTVTVSGRARVADHPNGVPLQNDEATQMTCASP